MKNSVLDQVIADVSRDIIAQLAPHELPLFRATSAAYFKNADRALRGQASRDDMLGFGVGGAVTLLTPIVFAVVTEVATFVTAEVKKSVAAESTTLVSDLVKQVFKRLRPGEKRAANDPPSLTPEQLAQVRKLAYEKACQLKLSEAKANLLADSIAGNLALAHA